MNPDLGKWNIFERAVEYKLAKFGMAKRCADRTVSQRFTVESREACEKQAYINGAEIYSYTKLSVVYDQNMNRIENKVGNCYMSNGGCRRPEYQINTLGMGSDNWNIYIKEPHTAETSIGKSNMAEESVVQTVEVIDLKRTDLPQSSVSLDARLAEYSLPNKNWADISNSVIQVFALIGVLFICVSACKSWKQSDYVHVSSPVEREEI